MVVPSNPSWVEEHIRRLTAAGIQSEFQCYNINSFETIERMIGLLDKLRSSTAATPMTLVAAVK
jgi:hypothetical protein